MKFGYCCSKKIKLSDEGEKITSSDNYLYAKLSYQRILENSDFRCGKGENYEQECNNNNRSEGNLRVLANKLFTVQKPRFVKKCNRCGNEEYSDIYPIGRFADHAIVCVK